MKKVSLGCLFCAFFLSACVKTEPPQFTPPSPPVVPDVNKLQVNADGILQCLFAAQDNMLVAPRVELSIDKGKVEEIFALIDQHNVKNVDHFWKVLGRQDRNQLAQWIGAGYEKLDQDSPLRQYEMSAYNAIFANGMINVAKEEREANIFYFTEVVGSKESKNSKVEYQYYGLKIHQEIGLGSGSAAVTYCKGQLK